MDARRDDGDGRGQARPFADKLDDTAPPAFAPLPGYGPNEGAVQPPNQQQYMDGTQYGSGAIAPVQPQQPCCGQQIQTQVVVQTCCPAPQPQPCCPAPQPQPCCPAPQPQPCCPAPQPQPCCPAPQPEPCCPAPPPPQWGPWSDWSQCQQVPCSAGGVAAGSVQTRTRTCSGSGGCQGESEQRQNCGCLQGQWTAWGPPTTCSATCGSGVQTRSRSCTVPGTCPGIDTDQSPCGASPCVQWSDFGPPEQCPVTCGQGSTVRRRKCVAIGTNSPASGCQGPDSQQAPCPSLPPCCSDWSSWSSCSSTCGSGVQTRTKTCQGGYGSSTEQQACAAQQPCCSDWSQWGGCQTVCGQGVQTRTRSCGNSASVLGSPSLPASGGCCNNQQQQPCQVGCTPNTAYGNYFMAKRMKRSLFTPLGRGSENITYTV
uniref:Uncharacterized protein n=1 Tax=Romanomermis culicivorax TaxID=13658 RepID=A0A915JF34_ROMCU